MILEGQHLDEQPEHHLGTHQKRRVSGPAPDQSEAAGGPSDPSVRSAPEDPGARWAGEPRSAVRDFGGDGQETDPALRLTPGHDGEKLS